MHFHTTVLLAMIVTMVQSCNNQQQSESSATTESRIEGQVAGPPVIIYKTKADYFDKVPVILSSDKEELTGFPGVRDIISSDDYTYPTILEGGFLLDNRGINENVAFLRLTYEEYSQLDKTPSKEELMEMILEADPLLEMYHCGSRFSYGNIVEELNTRIVTGELDKFKRLK